MANRIRPVSPKSPPSIAGRFMASAVIAGLLLVTATVYTVVNGELRIPFVEGALFRFGNEASAAEAEPAAADGSTKVWASYQPIPAFTKVGARHLRMPNGQMSLTPVIPDEHPDAVFYEVLDVGKLLNRVLKADKPANRAFKESDFLPEDTRAGVNAGIPPGKRGVWVDLSKVTGLADLQRGDVIDLVAATAPSNQTKLDTKVLGKVADTVMKARLEAAAAKTQEASAASTWVAARAAKVIVPARKRPVPGASPKRANAAMLEEAFLAIEPEDVVRLTQALAQEVTLLAAPRSSQPIDEPAEIEDQMPEDAAAALPKLLTGDEEAEGTMQMVEVIRGGARETVTVPRQEPRKSQR